ncbi:hypothetical protein [Bartonella sp. HY406]|uniref:hypothetical protein n=1 Tax=Bartonella sp. HY406 TaxID=2979331 RepID=UPI0021C690DC|nr:hypothetical protein [Bartonella sp. HY406]UXN02635.1 hypothetical protein N6B01_09130 [Bartonella sp. HY406]
MDTEAANACNLDLPDIMLLVVGFCLAVTLIVTPVYLRVMVVAATGVFAATWSIPVIIVAYAAFALVLEDVLTCLNVQPF